MSQRPQQEVEAAMRAILARCQKDAKFLQRCVEDTPAVLREFLEGNQESSGKEKGPVDIPIKLGSSEGPRARYSPEELAGMSRRLRDMLSRTAEDVKKNTLPAEAQEFLDKLTGKEDEDDICP